MNYIKKLESENEEKQREIERLEQKIQELRIYLDNPKFKMEGELQGYVNIADVYRMLDGI